MTRWALAVVLTCAACGGAADAERRGDEAYGLGEYPEALEQYSSLARGDAPARI